MNWKPFGILTLSLANLVGISNLRIGVNSVIERKSGLAQSRKELLNHNGHKVIYVIDGSGNFQRKNAISTILKYSDLTVNFSDEGLDELIQFINKDGKL